MRPPKAPPSPNTDWAQLGSRLPALLADIRSSQGSTLPDGRYLHWDELRHRAPPSPFESVEQWWAAMRMARRVSATSVGPMTAALGRPFSFVEIPSIRAALHRFDRQNVSKILAEVLGDEDALTEYRVRALIEEAISSSAIEGARPTTREMARRMVREGREPRTKDEVMIVNNWHAMQRIVELRAERRALRLEDLLELHRIVGEGALDVPESAGTLRGPEHDVQVADLEGGVWHVPPPAVDPEGQLAPLPERVQALLDFANGSSSEGPTFIHPVLRAIISHFWLGYEHPFRDGNGRMARALFYWVMLSHGYEMAEFLSISGPIDRKPSAYYRAFAFVENDDGDLTYFVLHQLRVLDEALQELLDHLKRRAEQAQELVRTIAGFEALNHRQQALLQTAVRHPLQSYTIKGHASAHRVHPLTARADLANLVELGYLAVKRVGKGNRYSPAAQLDRLIEADADRRSR